MSIPPADPPPERPARTSLTLLERLRARDEGAWSRLVYLYGPLVRHWAVRRGVTGADADDVAQEVFRAVAAGLEGFRGDRSGATFRGWLCGVTRNMLLRHAERARQQPRTAGGTDALRLLRAVPDGVGEDPDGDAPPPSNWPPCAAALWNWCGGSSSRGPGRCSGPWSSTGGRPTRSPPRPASARPPYVRPSPASCAG